MRLRTLLPFALAAALIVPVAAESAPVITATLHHDAGTDIAKDSPQYRAADEFFSALDKLDGKIVDLDLTIWPSQEGDDPGYGISPLRGAAEAGADSGHCETGNAGFLDNIDQPLLLASKHPAHFHAPIEIIIGARLDFPQQHIACEYRADGGNALRVKGRFAIQTVSIPTAIAYRLTPAN